MLELKDFPPETRLKLDDEGEELLWKEVDERGGVRSFCSDTCFGETDVYNWRNHCDFYPLDFVLELLDHPSRHVEAFRGGGRARSIEGPELPLNPGRELLTRVVESVSVNRDGVPVYRSREVSLVERFRQLLQQLGEFPVSVYSRSSGYELRYPKLVHEMLEKIEFEPLFAAMVDENGRVEDGKLVVDGREKKADEFSGELFSRDMRLELAIERDDREEIERLIGEEARKVREAFS